jgi:uncharacterized protein involved in exopolysaccharide biosynthesis
MKELLQKDRTPATIIFQRLQAEEALKEMERKEARLRIAHNVRLVWGERTFLVRLSLLGLVLGAIVAFLIPPRYVSSTRLMPPDNQYSSSIAVAAASMATARGPGGFGELAGDLLGLKSTSDLFVGILNSRTVQDEIIQQFDLKHVYSVTRMEDARLKLTTYTNIAIDRKSDITTIAVTDRNPQRAQAIAKAYVDRLNLLVSELSTSSAHRERVFLEGRLAQVNLDLESAEQEFSQFASKNSTVDLKEQERAMVEEAATLQGRLISAQSELEGLRQIYSDTNVRVRSAKARAEALQRELDKIGGKGDASSLNADSRASDLYPSIRKLPLLGVTYADLYRRSKVQESVYETLTQQYELARVQEAKEIPTVKVLDAANIPETKNFPPRRLICIASVLLAFLGGIIFLLTSNSWNEKDPRDLSKAIATEIWLDLKAKRFLNSVNGAFHEPGFDSTGTRSRKRGFLSFLGLNNWTRNGNGSTLSSSDDVSEEEEVERYEKGA